jgi:hypothetical protein
VGGVAGFALVAAVPMLMAPAPARWYLLGVATGVVVVGVPFFVAQRNGTVARRMGATAEEWTSYELRKLHAHGWWHIDDICAERWQVDHALVGPGGVIAVETKWSSEWGDDRYHRGTIDQAVSQAETGARKLRALAYALPGGVRTETLGVVACWGARADTVTRGGAVPVLDGAALADWCTALPRRLDDDEIARVRESIEHHVARFDAHRRREGRLRGVAGRLHLAPVGATTTQAGATTMPPAPSTVPSSSSSPRPLVRGKL